MQLEITRTESMTINIELPLYLRVVKDYMTTYTAILSENEVHQYVSFKDGSLHYSKPMAQTAIPQKYEDITREEFMSYADAAISNAYDAYETLFDTAKHIEELKTAKQY